MFLLPAHGLTPENVFWFLVGAQPLDLGRSVIPCGQRILWRAMHRTIRSAGAVHVVGIHTEARQVDLVHVQRIGRRCRMLEWTR